MKLIKVKLINWHIFSNHTIELNGNTLITGENASGKSTLMDAIYFVLSGGDSTQFNKAANVNDRSQRTIESYTRGKIGSEKNPFLRNDSDIISYIILEFVHPTTKEHLLLGVEIETQSFNNRPKTRFFTIAKTSIRDEDFIKDNKPISYHALKSNCRAKNIPLKDLADSLRERQITIGRDIFKLVDYKRFFDLLKNAISFKPISEVSSFVNSFLLKEDDINLDSLREEIRSYQEIEKLLTKEKEKIEFLSPFISKAERYKENEEKIEYLKVLELDYQIQKDRKDIENKNYQMLKLSDEHTNLEAKEETLEKKKSELLREIEQLENNEEYKALLEKKDRYQKSLAQLLQLDKEYNQFQNLVSEEQKIVKSLNLSYRLTTDFTNQDYPLLHSHLEKYQAEVEEIENTLRDKKAKLSFSIEEKKKEKAKKEEELKGLRQGINNYPEDVNNLIQIAKDAIQKANPKETNPNVKPFCEYIEIRDPKWANALEGYLNTQRFNILVEPKYYDIVSKAYQENKALRKVYLAGIVNVEKIKESETSENSIMEKIQVENPYANRYARYLLGNLVCVEDVLSLKNYKSSITPDCMIYKNYVLKACDPRIYAKPFIGTDSIKKRITLLENEIQEIRAQIEKENREVEEIKEKISTIQKSHVREILSYRNLFAEIKTLQESIESLKNEIQQDEKSKGLFGLAEKIRAAEVHLEDVKKEIQDTKKKAEENRIEYGKRNSEIEAIRNHLALVSEEFEATRKSLEDEAKYEEFHKQYTSNNKLDISRISLDSTHAANSNRNNLSYLVSTMREYSTKYKGSLTPIIDHLQDYINEYYSIKNRDVVKYEQEAHDAYIRAEASFKEDFISKLKEKIERSQKTLDKINKNLSLHPFGNDQEIYKFHYEATKDGEFRNYYRIIMSGKMMESTDLFTEILDEKDNSIMKDLFDKITMEKSSSEDEITLRRYLDYRNYMNYDIKITNKDGDESYFSKISKEKSGGETQTPFYIVIASCFDELISKDVRINSTCSVVFDEAFNNMDEGRIKSLMEFYKELNIQLLIIVPSNRISSITKYMDSIVGLIKKNNYPIICNMKKKDA